MGTTVDRNILAIPKAELHVHIEGTVLPEKCRELAKKNGVAVADDIFTPDGSAYQYKGFIDLVTVVYQEMAKCLVTKDDYASVTYDYLKRCADEGTIYVELIACAGQRFASGISYKDMIDGIAEGIDWAKRDWGIESRINLTFERHRFIEAAKEDLEIFKSYPHPYIVGLDIAGGEMAGDIPEYKVLFEDIKAAYPFPLGTRMHAGEFQGPENVWDALELNPTRIGHGVRSIQDMFLIDELKKRNVVLEVCPTSNILAEIYPSFKEHPLRRLVDAGVSVCLNSDDPGLFGNSIGQEYQVARDHFGFSDRELIQATRTAIESSFADQALKDSLLRKLEDSAPGFFNQIDFPKFTP